MVLLKLKAENLKCYENDVSIFVGHYWFIRLLKGANTKHLKLWETRIFIFNDENVPVFF